MLIKYLPPVLMAFIICCTAAACLSTANSQLHSISEILTLDIYKTYFYRKAPEKHLILAAKGFILLIAMLAYLLLLFGNLSTIFQTAFLAFSGIIQLAVPAVGGLFWKKGTKQGAWAGTISGCIVVTIGTFFITSLPLGLSAFSWGLIVNAVLYIVVSLATKCPDEIVDKYITRVENYISAGTDVNVIVGNTILASTFRPEQLAAK